MKVFCSPEKSINYLIYRNQLGTSLQLTGLLSCTLLLNLDLNLDHPMLHFPPLKEEFCSYRNRSNEYYKKGHELKGGLKFRTVEKNQEILRVLKNPNGYLASMIWTEHADFSDIRIQRVTSIFEEKNIHAADSAVGRFIGHGIPVTKSVFYDNFTPFKKCREGRTFSQ